MDTLPSVCYERHHIISPLYVADTIYDFPLSPDLGHTYCYSMTFNCHPILVARENGGKEWTVCLPYLEIEAISFVANGIEVITLYNPDKQESLTTYYSNLVEEYRAPINFFVDWPLILGALYNSRVSIRVKFWRKPTAPFNISYTAGYVNNPYMSNVQTPCSDGSIVCYKHGFFHKI
jgi:hypothetical protein